MKKVIVFGLFLYMLFLGHTVVDLISEDDSVESLIRMLKQLDFSHKERLSKYKAWFYAKECGRRYEVSPVLIMAIIHVESSFKTKAVSSKGCKGLMQLCDHISRKYNVNPWHPYENICGGTRYLSDLYKRFKDWDKAIISYYQGEKRTEKGQILTVSKQYLMKVKKYYYFYLEKLGRK